jgi:hypothetical protein
MIISSGNSVPRKAKKRAPLLIANAADRLPSIERGGKNQSELGLKLPEIKV